MSNPYEVKVGQVWQDWDTRFRNGAPTYKKVLKIEGGFAYCVSTRNGIVISKSRISLQRFRPNSTGYKLVGYA
jgi:hypothetical protein